MRGGARSPKLLLTPCFSRLSSIGCGDRRAPCRGGAQSTEGPAAEARRGTWRSGARATLSCYSRANRTSSASYRPRGVAWGARRETHRGGRAAAAACDGSAALCEHSRALSAVSRQQQEAGSVTWGLGIHQGMQARWRLHELPDGSFLEVRGPEPLVNTRTDCGSYCQQAHAHTSCQYCPSVNTSQLQRGAPPAPAGSILTPPHATPRSCCRKS